MRIIAVVFATDPSYKNKKLSTQLSFNAHIFKCDENFNNAMFHFIFKFIQPNINNANHIAYTCSNSDHILDERETHQLALQMQTLTNRRRSLLQQQDETLSSSISSSSSTTITQILDTNNSIEYSNHNDTTKPFVGFDYRDRENEVQSNTRRINSNKQIIQIIEENEGEIHHVYDKNNKNRKQKKIIITCIIKALNKIWHSSNQNTCIKFILHVY